MNNVLCCNIVSISIVILISHPLWESPPASYSLGQRPHSLHQLQRHCFRLVTYLAEADPFDGIGYTCCPTCGGRTCKLIELERHDDFPLICDRFIELANVFIPENGTWSITGFILEYSVRTKSSRRIYDGIEMTLYSWKHYSFHQLREALNVVHNELTTGWIEKPAEWCSHCFYKKNAEDYYLFVKMVDDDGSPRYRHHKTVLLYIFSRYNNLTGIFIPSVDRDYPRYIWILKSEFEKIRDLTGFDLVRDEDAGDHKWKQRLWHTNVKLFPSFRDTMDATFFDTPHTCFLVILFFRLLLNRLFDTQLWRVIGGSRDVKEKQRCAESTFKLCYFLFSWTVVRYITAGLDWREDVDACWSETDAVYMNNNPIIRRYYYMQMGFYMYSLFAQIVLDEYRKDFWMMIFHHIVSLGLIIGSYVQSHICMGVAILMCFDISDIFLEGAKAAGYIGQRVIGKCLFIGLLLTWIYWRLYYYPFHVLRSVFGGSADGIVNGLIYYQIVLILLFLQQLIWSKMLLSVTIKGIQSGGELKDDREDPIEKTD